MGADSAVLVSDEAIAGSDALGTAKLLAAAIKRVDDVDLVLTAVEASDGYTGTLAAQLAELLGLQSATFAKHVEIADGTVKVQRQTEAGYDEVEVALPALVSVTAGVVEPRYPSFKGIMAAKNKPVDQVTLADLGIEASQVGWAGARQEITASGKVVVSVTDQTGEARYPSFKGIMAAKKKPVETWSLSDLGVDAGEVGLSVAWSQVEDTTARPPRTAGEIVTDEGDGGVKLVEFLASKKFV
jgi:electron transfer flavoprotein alpha/beta subunit